MKPNSISSEYFRKTLLEHQRPAREMIVTPGDSGCEPITKISGVPWWPADVPRPKCAQGHRMSFMTQFRLSDAPGFESQSDSLISFHYCQQCSYEGKMSWGWNCSLGATSGYDISVLTNVSAKQSDGLGTIAEVVIDPHMVTFRDVMDAPGYEDTMNMFLNVPDDYPQLEDDLDENFYPGVIHITKRKLGGWPSWVQEPEPPGTKDNERLYFIAQLDWSLCEDATWGGGGYAYIFLISSDNQTFRGELTIQTT